MQTVGTSVVVYLPRILAFHFGRFMMRTHKIAAIPADGIGIEVIGAGVEVLHALAQKLGDCPSILSISTGVRIITSGTAR